MDRVKKTKVLSAFICSTLVLLLMLTTATILPVTSHAEQLQADAGSVKQALSSVQAIVSTLESTGSISGRVTDVDGFSIQSASVDVYDTNYNNVGYLLTLDDQVFFY